MNTASATDTVIEQVTIKASAERVFEALANPEQRLQWWSVPGKFGMTHFESDLRPGGKWVMLGSGYGKNVKIEGVYKEVDRPRVLSFTWLPDWQPDATESLVRFELEEKSGVTTVRLTHSGLVTQGARDSHRGWGQILGLLQAYSEK
jgi:uncharacterized protein YndB with AHSA1/START domain